MVIGHGNKFFQRKSVQAVINQNQLLLIVFNTDKEEIQQWIR
ncbi:element excision factor XisH family protein [Nostoc sp.]